MSGKKMMRNKCSRLKQGSTRMISICCWKKGNLIERHAIHDSSTNDVGEERSMSMKHAELNVISSGMTRQTFTKNHKAKQEDLRCFE